MDLCATTITKTSDTRHRNDAETQLGPLQERRKVQKLNLLHKGRRGHTVLPMHTLQHHRRKANAYILPYSRINAYKMSFVPGTVRLWNSLPDKIRAEEN